MATEIVTAPLANAAADPAKAATPPKYGPEDHEKASSLKVVRLLDLGQGAHGKTGTFEFAGGFIRTIDVDAQTVWHSLFADLENKDWWRLVRHVETRTKCADGTIVVQVGPMWFWTRRTTPRGRDLAVNLFDLPDERYVAGRLTGAKAARDLILFLSKYERARGAGFELGHFHSMLNGCLAQAFGQREAKFVDEASRQGAAVTFCDLVMGYFLNGTRNANPAYLHGQVAFEERGVAWELDYEERNRKEVAERMQVVRAAKAAKRADGDVMGPRKLQSTEGVTSNGHTIQ